MARRLRALKDWCKLAEAAAEKLRGLRPGVEVYVFGSVVRGRITGASDIDLVVLPDCVDELRSHVEMVKVLEDELGDLAYLIDVHVVGRSRLEKEPYKWWLRNSIKAWRYQ
ncbi:MAG: DNA polymerase beta domain-containing protein region [Candidatus Bathyarchaeota archaeon B24]|nr:MAG: DNA polymerase beta domain-containing protein region [Candidatus Bathyarchaeota archaeon B24]